MVWRGGVRLGDTVVFCDAGGARDLVFVSHAHVAARGAHGKLLASPRTLALMAARGKPLRSALPLQFGRPLSLGSLRIELFPSGHVPGAASLLLIEPSGRRIAYAGDVNPASELGEPAEVRGADVLVVAAPLASFPGRLPPRAEAHAQLRAVVSGALAGGHTPVILAPALGVAQEAQRVLAAAGVPLRAHHQIRAWSDACVSVGVELPPLPLGPPRPGERGAGATVLWPIELARSPVLQRAFRPLRIVLTGHALDPEWRARLLLGADVAIALADHADLPSLVEYVRSSGAREVYATAGFGAPMVAALAAIGVGAHPLGPPRQMELLP